MSLQTRVYFEALGGGNEIGASSYRYIFGSLKCTVDCGARPQSFDKKVRLMANGRNQEELEKIQTLMARPNRPFAPKLSETDVLILGHGHYDHVAAAVLLYKLNPNLKIYGTAPTKAFCSYQWHESITIAERNSEAAPFTIDEVQRTLERFIIVEASADLTQQTQLSDRYSFALVPAGHILGAASVVFFENGTPIGFHSGDYSYDDHEGHGQLTVAGAPRLDFTDLRFMVTESTRITENTGSRRETIDSFRETVKAAYDSGLQIRIMTFAIGRSTEAYEILRSVIPERSLFIEGAAKSMSELYLNYSPERIDPNIRQRFVDSEMRSRLMHSESPSVVIIPSGMKFGGTAHQYIRHGLAKDNHLFINLGYLEPCSPEFAFFELAQDGDVMDFNGQTKPVYAQKARFNLTAHADKQDILEAHQRMNPEKTILVHGDDIRMESFLAEHPDQGFVKGENGTVISL